MLALKSPFLLLRPRFSRSFSSAASPPFSPRPRRRRFAAFLTWSAAALGSYTIGILISPSFKMSSPSQPFKRETSLPPSSPDDPYSQFYSSINAESRQIDDHIRSLPLFKSLRADPSFSESRPHLDIPASMRTHMLLAGTLTGADRIAVPPYAWVEDGGKSLVMICYLGKALSGFPGMVHGGLLASLLDEGLARCCFPALPNKVGVTANLNLDYRAPAPTEGYFVLRANTTKVEGRKAFVEGRIESLSNDEDAKDAKPTVHVEAKALFVEPKNAASLTRMIK